MSYFAPFIRDKISILLYVCRSLSYIHANFRLDHVVVDVDSSLNICFFIFDYIIYINRPVFQNYGFLVFCNIRA